MWIILIGNLIKNNVRFEVFYSFNESNYLFMNLTKYLNVT